MAAACRAGLARPSSYIVCVDRMRDSFGIKVVEVDDLGMGEACCGFFSSWKCMVIMCMMIVTGFRETMAQSCCAMPSSCPSPVPWSMSLPAIRRPAEKP